MKLIDLLVQELPKRGGWPEGATNAWQSTQDGEVYFFKESGDYSEANNGGTKWYFEIASDRGNKHPVTRDQYESALAASQKPAWNGEGLPPVGCECEWRDANVGWLPVTIKYISEQIVVMASPTNLCGVRELTEIAKDIICDKPQFRPLRTEADKKREDTCMNIYELIRHRSDIAEAIYDAIAAGKIPGVKLED